MNTAHIYCRTSSKTSAERGLSLNSQSATAVGFYERCLSDTVPSKVVYLEKGQSAFRKKFLHRPEGAKLWAAAQDGDHIVFPSIDRAFRNVYDFAYMSERFKERNITAHLVDFQCSLSTPMGVLICSTAAAYAEFESQMISQRVRESLGRRVKNRKPKPKVNRQTVPAGVVFTDFEVDKLPHGRIHLYLRVSHQKSVDSGISINVQEEQCLKYMDSLLETDRYANVRSGNVYRDNGQSAFSIPLAKRTAGRHLVADLRPGDHVVFLRMDRAFRNMKDMVNTMSDWQERGIFGHMVGHQIDMTNPMSEIQVTLLSMFAQMESRNKSFRSRNVAAYLKAVGQRYGEIPFGKKIRICKGRQMLVHDKRTLLLARYCGVLKRYGLTQREIEEHLEAALARRENREPIPFCGRWSHGKVTEREFRNDRIRSLLRLHSDLTKTKDREIISP